MNATVCIGAWALMFLVNASRLSAAPVINEIFYHPPQPGGQLDPTGPEDIKLEWIELHNPEVTAADLSGWNRKYA